MKLSSAQPIIGSPLCNQTGKKKPSINGILKTWGRRNVGRSGNIEQRKNYYRSNFVSSSIFWQVFQSFCELYFKFSCECLSREPDIVDVDNTVLESWAAVREWSILSSSALLSYDGCCRNVDISTWWMT